MEPGKELLAVAANLREYLERGVDVRLAALIFARPETSIFREEILPSIAWFHARSGKHSNFYFAGYRRSYSAFANDVRLNVRGESWIYSPWQFDRFREELENASQWRYSGGTDVILTSGRAAAALDFSEVVAFNLEQLRAEGAMLQAGMLFERIFQAAEASFTDDAVEKFSDRSGGRLIASAALNAFLSVLPETVRTEALKARHFAVRSLA